MASRRVINLAAILVGILVVSTVYYVGETPHQSSSAKTTYGVAKDNTRENTSETTEETATSILVNIVGIGASSDVPIDFSPLTFTVTEGESVTIVLNNTDVNPHELVIPQFDVTTGIVQGGTTARVSFVPNVAGDFPFFQPVGSCSPDNPSPAVACPQVELLNGTMTVLSAS